VSAEDLHHKITALQQQIETLGLLWLIHDMTTRRQAEMVLRDSEARCR